MNELQITKRSNRSTYMFVVETKDNKEIQSFQTRQAALEFIDKKNVKDDNQDNYYTN